MGTKLSPGVTVCVPRNVLLELCVRQEVEPREVQNGVCLCGLLTLRISSRTW